MDAEDRHDLMSQNASSEDWASIKRVSGRFEFSVSS
jgi:hypothetical protein